MSIFSSLKRYILTLGGLIGGDIDAQTDAMLATPSGVRATFQKTRENWTKQYGEVREAVAQLMMVLEQKSHAVEQLAKEAEQNKVKQKGAVLQFKQTNDLKYQQAFTELYNRDAAIAREQEQLSAEIRELQAKVGQYKDKLTDMQKRIVDLKKQEAAAIADIVSSQQIISLNDRLNNMSLQLDDRNLQAVQERRESLKAQAKLSEGLAAGSGASEAMDRELLDAGRLSEASEVFAAMLADTKTPELPGQAEAAEKNARQREL